MQRIPLAQIPAQTFNIVLAEQNCTIAIYWKQERLYLDLTTQDGVVCTGRVCQNRASILQFPNPLFKGTLHFFDTGGDRPPHWGQLDTRYILVYAAVGEVLPDKLRY